MKNCYSCSLRRNVPGSAHSSCNLAAVFDGPGELIQAMQVFIHKGRIAGVEGNPYGIKNGWCNWPLDFDPVWIECSYHQEIKIKEGKNAN